MVVTCDVSQREISSLKCALLPQVFTKLFMSVTWETHHEFMGHPRLRPTAQEGSVAQSCQLYSPMAALSCSLSAKHGSAVGARDVLGKLDMVGREDEDGIVDGSAEALGREEDDGNADGNQSEHNGMSQYPQLGVPPVRHHGLPSLSGFRQLLLSSSPALGWFPGENLSA